MLRIRGMCMPLFCLLSGAVCQDLEEESFQTKHSDLTFHKFLETPMMLGGVVEMTDHMWTHGNYVQSFRSIVL